MTTAFVVAFISLSVSAFASSRVFLFAFEVASSLLFLLDCLLGRTAAAELGLGLLNTVALLRLGSCSCCLTSLTSPFLFFRKHLGSQQRKEKQEKTKRRRLLRRERSKDVEARELGKHIWMGLTIHIELRKPKMSHGSCLCSFLTYSRYS